MSRILPIALLSLLCINSANADLYSASNALSRGDYETAVAEFTKLAEKGDDKAQANLGYMYYAGEGVPQDYKQAVYWYRKAGVQGNRDAQYNLAVSYAFGEGVAQDLTEAAIWYRRAGEQGHVVSQYSLGISYAYGEGVPQDQTEAARWFTKAANQGYARAQVQLGSMHHTGEGVAQDYSEAVRWYRMAADRGDATAQYNLGTMYRSGKGVEQNYSQAKRWFRQSADQGYAAAQNELASLERSAGANVSTRTVQAKPEVYPTESIEPIAKEELPETTTPEPIADVEPAHEEKLTSNETAAPTPETKQISEASSTDELAKKPLFSVDKKDLLTLDSSQLDIPEPILEPEATAAPVPDITEEVPAEAKTPAEVEIAEVVPAEDVSVDVDEALTDKAKVSAMHNAMGLPQPNPAQEKENGEPSENLFTAIGNLFSGDKDAKDEKIEESSEAVASTPSIAEDEPATEIIASGSDTEKYVAAEDPTLLTNEPVDIEELTKTETAVEEYVVAEVPSLLANEPVDTEELTKTETVVEEYVATEDPTLLTNEPVDTEELTETETAVEEYVATEDPTLLTEPSDAKQVAEDPEASGGFFSTIGKFFSDEEKQVESEIVEEETQIEEEIVIAKLDEPAPVSEEIELAQDVEDELSQYSVDAGRHALSYNDYKEAENQFRPLAEAGDSEAQSHLGSLYYVGNGVEQNFISAFLWYKKAADQDNVDAQYSIGNMYLLGEGIEQNNEEAAKWYALASEQGHVAATGNLRNLQKLDDLASKEPLETPIANEVTEEATETEALAEKTESIASENDITESIDDQVEQSTVSVIQDEVTDVEPIVEEYVAEADPTLLTTEPSSPVKVEEDNESSGGFFSSIGNFFSGDKKQTETVITEQGSQKEEEIVIAKLDEPAPVIEEAELAQDAENDLSQYSVGAGRRELVNGDFDAAAKQFRPLAEAGDSEAQSHLGSLYYVGKGVEQSIVDSFNWYKKAAEQGNVDAQYSLGNMYLLGEGVEQNNKEATSWYTLASEQGHVAATNNLNNLQKLDALNRENKLEQQAVAEQVIDEDISTEATTVKSYAAGDAPSTESLQSYPDTESSEVIALIDSNSDAEISVNVPSVGEEKTTQTSVADTALEAEPSEQSEFFEGLFGKNEPESTALKEDDNINLDDTDSVEEAVTETTVAQIENETDETIATVTEETQITEESEESGGLFGFIGKIFSSDEEKEIVNEAVSEVKTDQELAMLEPELNKPTVNIGEIKVVEQRINVIEPKTELEQLRPLATQGDQDAQYKLGSLYYSGVVVKQDFPQSALWYRRAAQQGNVDAQYSLGNMYLMGEGIAQDDQQAAHWYALAADQGHMSASHNLENLQKSMPSSERLEIETNIVADESIANTETKEEDATNESATDATGKSDYEEGLAYAFGDGVPQNDRNAFNLFFAAAVEGYALAQYKVGVAYAYGEGVRQDNRQAAEWYQKAAEQGYTIAQRNLAIMYLDGNGIQQDKVHALAWYKVIASQGNAMDIRRRDMLEKELSETELTQSQELSNQISSRLSSNTSL